MDPDLEMHRHEMARDLRNAGWNVAQPGYLSARHSTCATEGCPVRTPRKFCHYCLKTMRLAA